ncbi:ROK family protein [Caldicellulosiruptoraceae bacterium PP1]
MKQYVASHLKDMNRRTVYQIFEEKETLSRAEVSRITGISAPTILKITSHMMKKNILFEIGEGESDLGRKPLLLKFNPEASYTIGIDFQNEYIILGIVDLKGEIKGINKIQISSSFIDILKSDLKFYIENLIKEYNIDISKILSVGIGIPGVVNSDEYIINVAPAIGITKQVNISHEIKSLSDYFNLPIYIENDVNAAAVGEFNLRNKNSYNHLVYLTIGNGVGAGIILNKSLYKGTRYAAGEVGYMIFDKNSQTVKEDRGWLEKQIDFNTVCNLSVNESHNNQIQIILDQVTSYTALCIANIASVLDIETFIVGGDLPNMLKKPFFNKLEEYTNKFCLNNILIERQKSDFPTLVGVATIARINSIDILLAD